MIFLSLSCWPFSAKCNPIDSMVRILFIFDIFYTFFDGSHNHLQCSRRFLLKISRSFRASKIVSNGTSIMKESDEVVSSSDSLKNTFAPYVVYCFKMRSLFCHFESSAWMMSAEWFCWMILWNDFNVYKNPRVPFSNHLCITCTHLHSLISSCTGFYLSIWFDFWLALSTVCRLWLSHSRLKSCLPASTAASGVCLQSTRHSGSAAPLANSHPLHMLYVLGECTAMLRV